MKVDGSCHCGEISFTAEINPEQVLICHCTDCQTLSGSAYRTIVPVLDNSFNLLSGNIKTYIKLADDGTRRTQTFCPECGTPIFAGPVEGESGMQALRVGVLSQRDRLPPMNQKFCGSAQSWVQDLSSATRLDG